MPRDPRPWFRKDRDAWFVTINGRRFNLGRDRKAAHRRFHALMLRDGDDAPDVDKEPVTVFSLFDNFLEWTKAQRAEATYEWYIDRIQAFVKHLKTDRPAHALKPYHVSQWVALHPRWSTAHQRNSIQAIKRAYRWGHRMGYLNSNPLEFLEKPSAGRREQIVTPDEYKLILAKIPRPQFRNLITTAWETGAQPQELLRVEMRHVELPLPPRSGAPKNRCPQAPATTSTAMAATSLRTLRAQAYVSPYAVASLLGIVILYLTVCKTCHTRPVFPPKPRVSRTGSKRRATHPQIGLPRLC